MGGLKLKTRKEKREHEKDVNYFFELLKIKKHFFKEFNIRLKRIKDDRHQSYIEYGPDIILLVVLLKNICNLTSMRSMTDNFNKDKCIENIGKILEIENLVEIPHYDTVNDFLSNLEVSQLEGFRTYMIKELLKKRCLEDYRVKGKYWGVIFDGTGLFTFNEKHCKHCLKRVYNKGTTKEKTVYMHHVLEAKLVIGNMVLSIGTEFIENESEDVSKQDCEMNAFHRLAKKIKKSYPKLPICIMGDSLYACEPVFKRCDDYRWKYLIRFKEGRIKSIASEFNIIKEIEEEENKIKDICWVKDISYNDRKVNLIEFIFEAKNKDTEDKITFIFLTDINITERNVKELVTAGRSRWKIENEGFNNQKNRRYDIMHSNSHNYNAMKNHYILIQIADIIIQLFENGSKILKKIKKTVETMSLELLEAFRNVVLTEKDMHEMTIPMQVRFT